MMPATSMASETSLSRPRDSENLVRVGVARGRLAHVEGRQRRDLRRFECEVEDRGVLALPPGIGGFRDGADPLLDVPAEDDLRGVLGLVWCMV